MSKVKLPNAQWQKIFAFLQQQEGIHLGKEAVRRQFKILPIVKTKIL